MPSFECLIFPNFDRFPTSEDFLVCPFCGSERRLILRGECPYCYVDNEPCPDYEVGKFSILFIFKCRHEVLICFGCSRNEC